MAALCAQTACAEPLRKAVITEIETVADGSVLVEVLLVNDGDSGRSFDIPARIDAEMRSSKVEIAALERSIDTPASLTVAPGGFAKAHYRLAAGGHPWAAGQAPLISIPLWHTAQVAAGPAQSAPALALASEQTAATTSAAAPMADAATSGAGHRPVQSRLEREENGFLTDFSPYEPSYVVFGNAKDSEWRVQLSFKYHLLGSHSDGARPSWRDGLYFGFTNKLFWDIASDSSFRDANYLPELFYRTPEFALSGHTGAGLQVGLQHESNGRSGKIQGRSVNNVYISPTISQDLGDGYRLSLAPRAMLLVGGKAGNPDILTYRGATSLDVSLGKDDGLLLSASGRYNFNSGKGALETDLSYPIDRIVGGPNFYLFVQSFTGYGESLFDYNRRMSRLRIGFAITR